MGPTNEAVQTRLLGDGVSQLKRRLIIRAQGARLASEIPLELWAGAVGEAVEYAAGLAFE
jgi:hypothetical protein